MPNADYTLCDYIMPGVCSSRFIQENININEKNNQYKNMNV